MDRPDVSGNRAPAAPAGPSSSERLTSSSRTAWRQPSPLSIAAWIVILACSLLPTVILQELFGGQVSLTQRAAVTAIVVAAAFLASVAVVQLRALRPLLMVLLTLVGTQWLVFGVLARADQIRALTGDPAFAVYMPTEVMLNLLVTAAMVAVLTVLKRDRHAFFLARGDLAALAGPIPWLAVRPGDRWSALGRNLTLALSLGTLAFLVLAGTPTSGLIGTALPVLPAILFAAALNAFNEEVTYKASILSALEEPLGRRDALRMVAAYFGIAHFYGVPYGVVGVALAWFLGWILARSMAETRGMAWAWFIHFVQDVLIFAFLAASAIVPGGG
jgi:CAAX protease family protein